MLNKISESESESVETRAWTPKRLSARSQVQTGCHTTILQTTNSTFCRSRRPEPSVRRWHWEGHLGTKHL